MNKFRILFSKGTLLNRLLRKYAVIMIGVTMTATVIFSIHTWEQNQKQAENMTSDAVQSTSRMLNDKTTLSRINLDVLNRTILMNIIMMNKIQARAQE